MTAAGAQKRFTLELATSRGVVQARVASQGPENPLSAAMGRDFQRSLRLAALLYPVCPQAHQAAALNAVETGAGVELPAAQQAARELIVCAEAIVGCVWRHGISWPQRFALAPDIDDVRAARRLNDALPRALYTEGWARIGGAPLRPNGEFRPLVDALVVCARRTIAKAQDALDFAPSIAFAAKADDLSGEETPRLMYGREFTPTQPLRLRDWLDAQISHLDQLTRHLEELSQHVGEGRPADVATDKLSGSGVGVAMTARGRLRHAVTVDEGRLVAWRATAPTDQNFAANGPVAALAETLPANDDLPGQAEWLICAFDPCAPCGVTLTEGDADA